MMESIGVLSGILIVVFIAVLIIVAWEVYIRIENRRHTKEFIDLERNTFTSANR